MEQTFKALVLEQTDDMPTATVKTLNRDALPEGDVLVRVAYSSLNYKDGLASIPDGKIVRSYPFVPGIDMCGVVAESNDPHFKHGDAEALNPAAEAVLSVPFGVPVGEEKDCGARAVAFPTRASRNGLAGGKELGVDGVVFRPGRFDGTSEGKNVLGIEAVIAGRRGGVPIPA